MFKEGEEKFPEFEGYILHYQRANVYWEKDVSETGGGTAPDCASIDGIKPTQGENIQSDSCLNCPKNQWGSDPKTGKGKACKNIIRMHILRDGDLLPIRLTIPPTSLKVVDEYMTYLTNKGLPYQIVKTKFSLEPAKGAGMEYSKLKLTAGEFLKNKEDMLKLKSIIDKFKQSFGEQIESEEYVESKNDDDIAY